MITNNLNLNNLRVFECVHRKKSMTLAAQELHLTQPGVTQHIKTLEETLEVKLFERVRQRLVPTEHGNQLATTCTHLFEKLEGTIGEMKGNDNELRGTIPFGTPIEFGNNLIMPLLSKFSKEHPKLKFALRYGFVTEMYEGLLRGDLDFAFVDAFASDKRIHTERVYDEELYLCATPECFKRAGEQKETPALFEKLEYVDYQVGEPVLRMWFRHHYKLQNPKLNVRATVMDVQGVARLILNGSGAGILPGYLMSHLEKGGTKLVKFKGSGKPLKNTISVAYLKERKHSRQTQALLDVLTKSLRG